MEGIPAVVIVSVSVRVEFGVSSVVLKRALVGVSWSGRCLTRLGPLISMRARICGLYGHFSGRSDGCFWVSGCYVSYRRRVMRYPNAVAAAIRVMARMMIRVMRLRGVLMMVLITCLNPWDCIADDRYVLDCFSGLLLLKFAFLLLRRSFRPGFEVVVDRR